MCSLTNLVRFSTKEELETVFRKTEENIKNRIKLGKKTSFEIVELLMKQNLAELRRSNYGLRTKL